MKERDFRNVLESSRMFHELYKRRRARVLYTHFSKRRSVVILVTLLAEKR